MKKLSVITVNFNNAQGLLKTIKSVQNQLFKDFEFIIIDGGSTDESLDIIRHNMENVNYHVSEKDNGVYHAMNKGIKKATGEYCLFLNSGDCLFDENVLKIVFQQVTGDDEIVYGNSYKTKSHYRRVIKYNPTLSLYDFYKIEPALHHQATFIKRELFDKYGVYDESIKIIADWEFFFRVIVQNEVNTRYIDLIICKFDGIGLSNSLPDGSIDRIKMEKVKEQILKKNFSQIILIDYQMFDTLFSHKSFILKVLNRLSYFSFKK